MTPEHAAEIASWRYERPYEDYGYADENRREVVEYLTEPANGLFDVLNESEMIGFRSFGVDGRVPGGNYDDSYQDTGGSLRPDLTGKGLGTSVIEAGLLFGSDMFGTTRFRVTIADFNSRARRACEKVGFRPVETFCRTADAKPYTILTIDIVFNGS